MIKLKFIRPLLICFFCFSNVVFAQFDIPEIPKEQTSIYDYINLLSATEKQNLEQKLIKYSDTTSTQMVVAIISTTKGENIGLLAPKWAQKWGVGQAKEDNGVFILLAKDDRKIWISPGYGVEDRLIAGIVGELIRNIIIPEFKRDNYYSGLDKGVDAIFEVLTGAYQGQRKSSGSNEIPIGISKNRRNGGGKRSLSSSILDVIILSSMGRRSSGGFGRSSGGGFSGGFGGGGFSGGGAGGSW